jgi:hypothetical protein
MRAGPTRRGRLRMPAVSAQQFAAFRYIVRHQALKGRAPLMKELRAEMGLDTDNQATSLVLALKRAGFLRTTRRIGGIEVTAP